MDVKWLTDKTQRWYLLCSWQMKLTEFYRQSSQSAHGIERVWCHDYASEWFTSLRKTTGHEWNSRSNRNPTAEVLCVSQTLMPWYGDSMDRQNVFSLFVLNVLRCLFFFFIQLLKMDRHETFCVCRGSNMALRYFLFNFCNISFVLMSDVFQILVIFCVQQHRQVVILCFTSSLHKLLLSLLI